MWKSKLSEWLKYTKYAIKTKNHNLPVSKKLEKAGFRCLDEMSKTDMGQVIARDPNCCQFFFSPYTTSLNYHQAIMSASLSGSSLSNFVLVRPQLESALIFLYFINASSIEQLFERVEEYYDWVAVKMYQNSKKSDEFDFANHITSNEDFKDKITVIYEIVIKKYGNREQELKKLNRASFISNKRNMARLYDIEGLFLHVQAETSSNIHISDVSDRSSYDILGDEVLYSFNDNKNDCFWAQVLSNMIQTTLIKEATKYFDTPNILKEELNKYLKTN